MKITVKMTISEIVKACGGRYLGENCEIKGFCTDSGEIFSGAVFVAIKGERRDGADFIPDVIKKGAVCAISATAPEGFEDRVILVDDSVEALIRLGGYFRSNNSGMGVVAVTGSVGKTTTKEMIYAVLSEKYNTHRSEGNHNSLVGLPLSLMTMKKENRAAVYEMGMSSSGSITRLSKMARPNVAVITNIGTMHIENLGSREGIRDAKCEIVDGLSKDGVLILNGDEPLLAGREGAVYVALKNKYADVYAYNICEGENGSSFDLVFRGEEISSIVIPTFGEHNILNAAMAFCVGKYFGMTENEIRRGLMNFKGEAMRQRFVRCGDIEIMEDCYNAGPESMRASLGVLESHCKRKGMRPVAVIGAMRELGSFSESLHKEVGKFAGQKAELIFTVKADAFGEGALEGGILKDSVVNLGDMPYDAAAEIVNERLLPGDCVLFKASRGVRLEELMNRIKSLRENK